MAVVYAVKNGNWSDPSTWNTGALPQPGDTVCANNYTVTIDQDVDLWVSGSPAGIITTRAYSPAVAGGGFTCERDNTVIKCKTIEGYTTTLTITANNATIYSDVVGSNHASTQYLYAITFGGAGTLQIYGNVTGGSGAREHYGVHNNSSGTISITGNVTGGSSGSAFGVNNNSSGTISITGNVTGGSADRAHGVNNSSSGTISVTGNVTGGSSWAYGVNNNSTGTISITGNVTGGSSSNAYGVNNNSTGTINITGNVTGGSGSNAYGVNNGSTGIVNVTGTSHYGKAAFAFYSTANGTLRVVGDLYADPSPAVYWTGSSAYCAIDGNEYGGISGAAQGSMAACVYKRAQPQAKNRFIRVAEADSSLSGYSGQAGYFYGALYGGTLGLPSEDDVRAGVAYGPSSELTGTCAVPPPESVLYGVPVDNTTGEVVITPEAIASAVWDALRSEHAQTGTFGAVAEWAGAGGGSSDWTDDEKKQIRYRLGIDGDTAVPTTNSPHLGTTYGNLDQLAAHGDSEWTKTPPADIWTYSNRTITGGTVDTVQDKDGYTLSSAGIDAIWDEPQSGHTTAGTFGAYLNTQISSRAPADTALSNLIWTNDKASYLDAAISSRLEASSYVAPDNASIASIKSKTDAYLDAAVSSRLAASAYTPPDNASISSIKNTVDTKLDATISSRAPANTALSNTVWTDAKADFLDAAISSRLAASDYTPPDNASIASIKNTVDSKLDVNVASRAPASTALSNEIWTNAKAAYLDAAISSRLDASSYVAPDNTSISAIKTQTDKFQFDSNNYVYAVGIGGESGTDWTDTEKQQIRYRLGIDGATQAPSTNSPHLGSSYSTLDDLAAHVSTRLAASDYVAPDNSSIADIKAKTDKLTFDTNNYVYSVATNAITDWTDAEKQQIRYRLGIDGTTASPQSNTPHLGSTYSTLDDLAAHVSTRLAASDYTPPDNASIAAIKTKTDQLSFDTEKVLAKVSDPVTISSTDVSAIVDGVWDEPAAQHTQTGSTGALLGAAGSGSVDYNTMAQAVWQYTTRELTGFNFQVTVASNLDKNGYALTSAYDRAKDALKYTEYTAPDNTSIAVIKTKTDQLSFDTGKVLAKVSDPVTISSTDVSAIVDGVWDEPAAQHTTSGSTGAALNNAGSGSVDTGAIAQAVWQYTTRELTGFSFQVTVETNLDKIGYSLTSAYDRAKDALKYTEYTAPDNASISAIKTQTDKLAFAGNDVKATLDGEAVTVAINQDKIGYSLVSDYDRAKDALKYTEYTAPDNTDIIAILNQVNRIQFTPENYIRSAVTNPETIAQTIFTYDITKAENLAPAYSLTTLILGSLYMVTSNNTLTIYKSNGLPHLTRNLGIDPLDGHISAIRP